MFPPLRTMLGFGLWREANDAALASERCSHVKIAATIEGETLRTSEAAEKRGDFAGGINSIDAVEAGGGRAGDEEFSRRTERKVIGRKRRLERGENENFAVGSDFKNCAAAIADVEAAAFVERETGGDAHAFDPLHGAAVRRDAMDGAVVAAGNEEMAVRMNGQARGVHHFGDERLHQVIRSDSVERDGNFLSALAAEGDVNISVGVNGGAGDGVEIVGDLHAQRHGKWRAFDAAHADADGASGCSFGDASDQ